MKFKFGQKCIFIRSYYYSWAPKTFTWYIVNFTIHNYIFKICRLPFTYLLLRVYPFIGRYRGTLNLFTLFYDKVVLTKKLIIIVLIGTLTATTIKCTLWNRLIDRLHLESFLIYNNTYIIKFKINTSITVTHSAIQHLLTTVQYNSTYIQYTRLVLFWFKYIFGFLENKYIIEINFQCSAYFNNVW